jgi:hypothetical protein
MDIAWWRLMAVACLVFLTGCPQLRPLAAPPTIVTGQSLPALTGAVRWTERYQTQSSTSEVANGATVSLIDPGTGQTVATTLTQANGNFSLTFSNWTPTASYPYVLEAVKGLSAGGNPNRVGAAAARLRTLISLVSGNWTSITGNGIQLSRSTTALCVISSLKGLTTVQQQLLMGTVTVGSPDVFSGTANISTSEYSAVWGLVDTSLTLNQDPVRSIAREAVTGAFGRIEHGPIVTDVSTTSAAAGNTIIIYGSGFDPTASNNQVLFNGIAATSVAVNATGTQLTVSVPTTPTSGPLTIRVGNLISLAAPNFGITFTVGTHNIQTFAGTVDPAGLLATSWGFTPQWVATDSLGNCYLSDSAKGCVYKVSPGGGISLVAGNGSSSFAGDGGAATLASLNTPCGLVMDSSGNLLIADSYNNRIRMVCNAAGTYFGQAMTANRIYTIAGNGAGTYAGDGGAATSASMNAPFGLALDGLGNLLIADRYTNRVRMVCNVAGTYFGQAMTANNIYTVAGSATQGFSGDGGAAASASMWNPIGVAVDGLGNLLISDQANNRIRMVCNLAGTYFGQAMTANNIYTIAGSATQGFSGDGGAATSASFNWPTGVALDGLGNLLISDTGNHRIRMVCKTSGTYFGQATTANSIYTIAGNGAAFAGDGGAANSAFMYRQQGFALDSSGNLLIADSNNNRIRMVCKTSGTYFGQAMTANDIYTIAGNGTAAVGGDGGAATSASLDQPRGVRVDSSGNLLIADSDNNVIRMVCKVAGTYFGQAMTANRIYTIAGNGTGTYAGDGGLATSASLINPRNVTLDSSGNLFIADNSNNRIRMVCAVSGTYFGQAMTANNIYTVAGNGTATFAGDGGAATSASLTGPQGVTSDSSGNLYIADGNNNRTRMVCKVAGTYFGQAMTANNIYTIAGGGGGGDGGAATSASLNFPRDITLDSSGNVVIDDEGDQRIRMVCKVAGTYFGQAMTANNIYTIAGNGTGTYAGDGGLATSASLQNPRGVFLDASGNLLIGDCLNNRVRMVCKVAGTYFGQTMTANNIYTIAGNGTAAFAGDGGLATSANLSGPSGVAQDSSGNLFIADRANNRIREVN